MSYTKMPIVRYTEVASQILIPTYVQLRAKAMPQVLTGLGFIAVVNLANCYS